MILKAYFTGIVDDLPQATLEDMKREWAGLTDKDDLLEEVERLSASRRQSMFETATRSNYLLVVAAFVIAANVAMLVAPDGTTTSVVLLKISTSMIVLAAAILTIAISAKSKTMKKPRAGGEFEPTEMLHQALGIESQTSTPALDVKAWKKFVDASNKLHKRKIVLVAERRAQWISAMLMTTGLLVMIAGICTR
jgi:hypothetical protein